MLLISYIQQYFNTSITVLTNEVWKVLIALFKVPNTWCFDGTFPTVLQGSISFCEIINRSTFWKFVNISFFASFVTSGVRLARQHSRRKRRSPSSPWQPSPHWSVTSLTTSSRTRLLTRWKRSPRTGSSDVVFVRYDAWSVWMSTGVGICKLLKRSLETKVWYLIFLLTLYLQH